MAMMYFNKARIQDIASLLIEYVESEPKQFHFFVNNSNRQLLESEIAINPFEVRMFLSTLARTGRLADKVKLAEDGIRHTPVEDAQDLK